MEMLRLLLIDKISPYLDFAKEVMVNDGYEVRVKDNSRGLKKIMTEFSPDIILLDIQLNNYDGFNILSRLRKSYKYKGPVIIISTSTKISDIEKAFELGAYDYLIKPLNLRDLRNKVRQSVSKNNFKKHDCHV